MNNVKRMLPLTLSFLLASGASMSDDDHESGFAGKFDLDRDGKVTRAEYDKAYEQKMKSKLTWLDTNKDGMISPEEFRDQHRIEFDQRWSMWDSDNDGVVTVNAVLQKKQASRKD